MAKFHTNKETGESGQCSAKTENGCPFGGASDHHDTIAGARGAYEAEMSEKNIPTVSKSGAKLHTNSDNGVTAVYPKPATPNAIIPQRPVRPSSLLPRPSHPFPSTPIPSKEDKYDEIRDRTLCEKIENSNRNIKDKELQIAYARKDLDTAEHDFKSTKNIKDRISGAHKISTNMLEQARKVYIEALENRVKAINGAIIENPTEEATIGTWAAKNNAISRLPQLKNELEAAKNALEEYRNEIAE